MYVWHHGIIPLCVVAERQSGACTGPLLSQANSSMLTMRCRHSGQATQGFAEQE